MGQVHGELVAEPQLSPFSSPSTIPAPLALPGAGSSLQGWRREQAGSSLGPEVGKYPRSLAPCAQLGAMGSGDWEAVPDMKVVPAVLSLLGTVKGQEEADREWAGAELLQAGGSGHSLQGSIPSAAAWGSHRPHSLLPAPPPQGVQHSLTLPVLSLCP